MRTVQKIIIVLLPFLFSSCASLINRKTQEVYFTTSPQLQLKRVDSLSFPVCSSHLGLTLIRARQPLDLEFRLKDSSLVHYSLKSGLSKTYIFGNLYPVLWPGYLIDLFSNNRFAYPLRNYFSYDSIHHKVVRDGIPPFCKNNLTVGLGWSFLNAYHSSLFKNYPGGITPFGLNLRINYYFSSHQSIGFEGGVAAMATPHSPENRRTFNSDRRDTVSQSYSRSYWLALSYNYRFDRLSLGAGISYSPSYNTSRRMGIVHRDTVVQNETIHYNNVRNKTLSSEALNKAGLIFNVDYRLGRLASAGVNWHLFMGDAGRSLYASHFFNFYLTFKVARINFNKNAQCRVSY